MSRLNKALGWINTYRWCVRASVLNFIFKVQKELLNVITLDQNKSENIYWIMTITSEIFLLIFSKWDHELWIY